MIQLDDQEQLIVKELIRNPRLSDNQIGKLTKVPVMTVNRKRKSLEERGLLNYYCYLDTSKYGLDSSPARQLYMIKLRIGITKKEFIDKLIEPNLLLKFKIFESFIGEKDGQLVFSLILEGSRGNETMEIFNGEIVPILQEKFGKDCIDETFVIRVTSNIVTLKNYIPLKNIERGFIKENWPKEYIFLWYTLKYEFYKNKTFLYRVSL